MNTNLIDQVLFYLQKFELFQVVFLKQPLICSNAGMRAPMIRF
jgi:hypothetical protein